jgi:uncharacterized protein YsxB (DUF464 family)
LIKVQIDLSKDEIHGISITGHGGGKKGTDIVCAAVSAAAETALAGLLHYGREKVDWDMQRGNLSIRLKRCEDKGQQSPLEVILKTLSIGLHQMEKQYPDRLMISLKNDSCISDKA